MKPVKVTIANQGLVCADIGNNHHLHPCSLRPCDHLELLAVCSRSLYFNLRCLILPHIIHFNYVFTFNDIRTTINSTLAALTTKPHNHNSLMLI